MTGTLAIIPARGGSKSIPLKNLAEVAGKPLVAWAIEAARGAERVDRVIVSSDDDRIRAIAEAWGAESFVRDGISDTETSDEHLGIVVDRLAAAEGREPERIVLLHPTSPLRTAEDVDGCLSLVRDGIGAAVSIYEPSRHLRHYVRFLPDRRVEWIVLPMDRARQLVPPSYALNGAVHVARLDYWREHGFFGPETVGYVMPRERSVDVDAPMDLAVADSLMQDRARAAA